MRILRRLLSVAPIFAALITACSNPPASPTLSPTPGPLLPSVEAGGARWTVIRLSETPLGGLPSKAIAVTIRLESLLADKELVAIYPFDKLKLMLPSDRDWGTCTVSNSPTYNEAAACAEARRGFSGGGMIYGSLDSQAGTSKLVAVGPTAAWYPESGGQVLINYSNETFTLGAGTRGELELSFLVPQDMNIHAAKLHYDKDLLFAFGDLPISASR